MTRLRAFLLDHRRLAACLIAAALLVKALVPAGFMPGTAGSGTIVVLLCNGQGGEPMAMTIPGLGDKPDQGGHKKAEAPCAFSSLSSPNLAAVDPMLLAIALLFAIAAGFRMPVPAPMARRDHLRPPLRGPPLSI